MECLSLCLTYNKCNRAVTSYDSLKANPIQCKLYDRLPNNYPSTAYEEWTSFETCPTGFSSFGVDGGCYELMEGPNKTTWTNADMACKALGWNIYLAGTKVQLSK